MNKFPRGESNRNKNLLVRPLFELGTFSSKLSTSTIESYLFSN